MVSLSTLKRRIWLFTMLSLIFFITSLLSTVLLRSGTTEAQTYFCNSNQLQTMRNEIGILPWTSTCKSYRGFIDTLLPTSVDVLNRPVKSPTNQSLSAFCTEDCVSGIQNLTFYPFQHCDTILDGIVRSLGSIVPSICPNGASVITIPPAPTTSDRAGKYCSYTELENSFGPRSSLPLQGKTDTCSQIARKIFFADVAMNGVPFSPITLDMVYDICKTPECLSLVNKLKNYTFPSCDTVVNDKTISLTNLSARMCVDYNVTQ